MTGVKISSNKNKDHFKKILFFNISIIILVLINIYLGYSLTKIIIINFGSDDDVTKQVNTSKIKIEVLNGCGIAGVAEKLTDYLRTSGFDVVKLGNYRSFQIENSIVIARNEKIQNAQRIAVASGLSPESVIQQTNPEYLLDVTFILGKDYKKLIPLQKRAN
ncbi:MAG: LytR C-terminal domain-containing protein [Ignavibacteriaceae bacterium]